MEDTRMTNYEMIKNLDIYAMALTIMCPYDMGHMEVKRCEWDPALLGKCGKCSLKWLEEECE